jgi:hypothetical protein
MGLLGSLFGGKKKSPTGLPPEMEEICGTPMPPPQVRQAEERIKFQRPGNHEETVRSLAASVSGLIGAK